jgi:hypothetical protein
LRFDAAVALRFQGVLHEYISAMRIAEPMIDATIEPKQPRRLEKNTNMGFAKIE